MDELVMRVAHAIKSNDKINFIGISGHGAAGKTNFTRKLIALLAGDKVNVVNTDPYIISSELRKYTAIDYQYKQKMYSEKITACHPSAHQLNGLRRDITMIKAGLDLYSIGTDYQESELLSATKEWTIVEGMSVAFIDPKLFDLTVYLYTDGETEFNRRRNRDITERGTKLSYLRKSHEGRRRQYELFMHPYSQVFDLIINNTNDSYLLEKGTDLLAEI